MLYLLRGREGDNITWHPLPHSHSVLPPLLSFFLSPSLPLPLSLSLPPSPPLSLPLSLPPSLSVRGDTHTVEEVWSNQETSLVRLGNHANRRSSPWELTNSHKQTLCNEHALIVICSRISDYIILCSSLYPPNHTPLFLSIIISKATCIYDEMFKAIEGGRERE